MRMSVQLNEVLKNPLFQHTTIVSGRDNLQQEIKWVHVLEKLDGKKWLSGGELILSSGILFNQDLKLFIDFVEKAIQAKATALCIECNEYFKEVPAEVLRIAQNAHFPIIIFEKEVRFIDITQTVHSSIIQKNFSLLTNLEAFSRKIDQILLQVNAKKNILVQTMECLQKTVIFLRRDGTFEYSTPVATINIEAIIDALKEDDQSDYYWICKSIEVLDMEYGTLYIVSTSQTNSEFERLVLDKSAIALAHIMLRNAYSKNPHLNKESEWVSKWIQGDLTKEKIQQFTYEASGQAFFEQYVALVFHTSDEHYQPTEYSAISLYIRHVFEQKNIHVFSTVDEQNLIFVLVKDSPKQAFKRLITAGIEKIQHSEIYQKKQHTFTFIGGGNTVQNPLHIEKSYRHALETLQLQKKLGTLVEQVFYEDYYMYRVVNHMHENGTLQQFIDDYLGEMIQLDTRQNSELLKTLHVYLQFNGSKTDTSEKLHIVRQTLYHRLNKIAEILGDDYLEYNKKQAIEFALAGYHFMQATQLQTSKR